jgi:hypothetical protein
MRACGFAKPADADSRVMRAPVANRSRFRRALQTRSSLGASSDEDKQAIEEAE